MILPLEDPCGGSAFADTAVRPMSTAQPRLTPLAAGARHQREKLAVLFAFPDQALQARPGFDALPALDAVFTQAGSEHPRHWRWHDGTASAPHLALAVDADGQVRALGRGSFGLGDELPRCVLAQPPHWRQAALFALTFAEDLAVLSGSPACPVWLCVTLPSHWAPEAALDRPAPWADGLAGGGGAAGAVSAGVERWLWSITDHPRLHAHPDRVDPQRWTQHDADGLPRAWLRRERRTATPLPGRERWLLTLAVDLQPFATAVAAPGRAAALAAAWRAQDPPDLRSVRERLLPWLERR